MSQLNTPQRARRIFHCSRRFFALSSGAWSCLLLLSLSVHASSQSTHLGCVPSPEAAFSSHAHVSIASRGADLPRHFDLRDTLPPVGDQGETGSCVGWSTAYYCYSTSVARQRKLTPEERLDKKFLFSPAFIWHQYNRGDKENGMHIYEAFDVLAKQGCATLADMPWDEKDVTTQPTDGIKARALRYRARQTVSLFKGASNGEPGNVARLQTWLFETRQPFVIGIPVYEDFFKIPHDPGFVYKPGDAKGKLQGFHAICLLGYDQDKHAFLMVNSWTTAWANKGFALLDEDFVTQNAVEGWGQRPGGPIARSTLPVKVTPSITYEPAKGAAK